MSHRDQPVAELLAAIASERVTPAGGTGVAIVGAVGAALCEMAVRHSLANDEPGEESDSLATRGENLATARTRLLDLADADADAVEAAFGPESGDADQTARKRAVGVPLSIAEEASTVLELATTVAAEARSESAADAAMGAFLAHAATRASIFAVRYNLGAIADDSFVTETEERVGELETIADRTLETVSSRLE